MAMFSNEAEASEAKRRNFLMATKASENASKKPRVESRSSCPPFKVTTILCQLINYFLYSFILLEDIKKKKLELVNKKLF